MRRRIFSLLLVPAAFCLIAGLLGAGPSILLFVTSLNTEDADAGRVGLALSSAFFIVGGVSLIGAIAGTRSTDRPRMWRSFFWWGVVAVLMVIPTGVLFGPTGAFHHHIGFGPFPFFYMVWNGEDPAPGSLQIINGYEVGFDPVRFVVLLAVWVAMFTGIVRWVRPSQPREALSRFEAT